LKMTSRGVILSPVLEEERYGIDELAERAGVTRRTVRYYVQRGLLAGPEGAGRGAHYTGEHLATLVRIRELQEQGVPLDSIAARLRGEPAPPVAAAPSQSTWTRATLADGVELHLRGRRLNEAQLSALRDAITRVIREEER
jgi:DNA-binding transcriptional MerR regulator